MKATINGNRANIWPCAIAGYFALFITAIAIFVAWAVRQRMDLVRPDYYEHEILYQRELDQLNRAAKIMPEVGLSYDATSRRVVLSLPPGHAGHRAAGRVAFYRPSDARLDREMPLALDAGGTQQVDIRGYPPGLWKVRVDWSVESNDYVIQRSIIIGPGGG